MNCLEEWKRIEGLPDKIEVSNFGRVRSNGKILSGEKCNNGYIRHHFSHKGKTFRFNAHKLVALAFLPNPNKKQCVNHIDGDKTNNRLENLEWCTYSENLVHAFKTGLRCCNGELNPVSRLTEDQVKEIRKLYVKGKHGEFNSRGLAKRFNVSPTIILRIVKRKVWNHILKDQ